MTRDEVLAQAAQVLPDRLVNAVSALPQAVREQAEELRLRRGFPMTAVLPEQELPVGGGPITADDLHTVLENASQASAHTVLDQVRNGFVTLRGGHRIGLCGTVVHREDKISALRYVTSLSVRVACPVEGQAEMLLPELTEDGVFQSTLILAPPGVGKTTLLRELIRCLSDGRGITPHRVGLADERGEIAALWQGEPQLCVGRHTDILDGCRKAEGMTILLRGMNPQVLAADEITDPADVRAMVEAAGCGVALLATAHGSGAADLERRPIYRALLAAEVFRRLVVLTRRDGKRFAWVEALS